MKCCGEKTLSSGDLSTCEKTQEQDLQIQTSEKLYMQEKPAAIPEECFMTSCSMADDFMADLPNQGNNTVSQEEFQQAILRFAQARFPGTISSTSIIIGPASQHDYLVAVAEGVDFSKERYGTVQQAETAGSSTHEMHGKSLSTVLTGAEVTLASEEEQAQTQANPAEASNSSVTFHSGQQATLQSGR